MSENAFYSLKPISRGTLPSATTLSQEKVIETLKNRRVKNTMLKFAVDNMRGLGDFEGQAFGVFASIDDAKTFEKVIRKAALELGWKRGDGMRTRASIHCSVEKVENGFVCYVVHVPALDTLVQRYIETNEKVSEKLPA